MYDPRPLFPDMYHPVQRYRSRGWKGKAKYSTRTENPVRYYFIDFGISSWFQPEDTNRLVTGMFGLDRDVPELSNDIPYDPFKVDVFILGNCFRERFTQASTDTRSFIFVFLD